MIVGIGIDIVDNSRMALAIQRHPKIIQKILTENEIKELDLQEAKVISQPIVNSIAARFAAKEALSKALGKTPFDVGMQNIEVSKGLTGAPNISLHAKDYEEFSFLCSLTHSEMSSVAVVISQKEI